VRNGYEGMNIPAHIEISHHFDFTGIKQLDQVVGDDVGYVFVVDAFVAEFIDVELEALEFHAPVVGLVADEDGSKVRKPRLRTKAGELRTRKLDRILSLLGAIREALELRGADLHRTVFFRGLYCWFYRRFFGHGGVLSESRMLRKRLEIQDRGDRPSLGSFR